MAVSKKLKSLYFSFFEKPEIFAANIISKIQERKNLKRNLDKSYKLTKEQKRQIKEFWKPYCHVSPKWAQYYSAKNGQFDPRYIPNDLYYTKIDQHFNSRKLGYGFNDKNYYTCLFSDVKQPKTIVRKIGMFLFDSSYKQINTSDAILLIKRESEIIIKPSQESGSGRGILFYSPSSDIQKIYDFLLDKKEQNYIIQSIVHQHELLKAIHENSLNTVRISTLLLNDGVHILSAVLRMGRDGNRVDNASNGGLSVGISKNGKLNKYGHILYSGEEVTQHPNGFVFENYSVPNFDEMIATVKLLAQRIANFRLVSWDLSVNDTNEVILIEANMRKGGIAINQFNNGPLFGDLTEQVLREVFTKN